MSMAYGDRFVRAQEAARDVIAGLAQGDEVAIIAFDNATVSVRELSTDLEGARAFIDGLSAPSFEVTRYMP